MIKINKQISKAWLNQNLVSKYTNMQMGFTVVELLIYMALMSIFLVILMGIFTAALSTKLASESASAIAQDSRYILSKLSYEVNNADSVTSPAFGATSSSLQIVASGSSSTYELNDGNLVKITC